MLWASSSQASTTSYHVEMGNTTMAAACQLTRKSLTKPSICAAMAAELGREPRRSRCAADMGLLEVPVVRLEACGDMLLYTSLS